MSMSRCNPANRTRCLNKSIFCIGSTGKRIAVYRHIRRRSRWNRYLRCMCWRRTNNPEQKFPSKSRRIDRNRYLPYTYRSHRNNPDSLSPDRSRRSRYRNCRPRRYRWRRSNPACSICASPSLTSRNMYWRRQYSTLRRRYTVAHWRRWYPQTTYNWG